MKTESIELRMIVDSPHNMRSIKKNDRTIKELAESMKELGQLVPVIVRKKKGKVLDHKLLGYTLLAGKRRFAAAKLAGLTHLRAEVVDVDDAAAVAITVTENLQREDLTPLQEAKQLKVLLDQDKDTKEIAATLGRPVSWVLRRAKLIDLIPAWTKMLDKVEHSWGAAHMELIARFDPATQKRWLDEFYDAEYEVFHADDYTVSHLAERLDRGTYQLKSAQWKLDDGALSPVAGPCTTCEKRSGRQPELFVDDPEKFDAKKDDKCLDANCWSMKEKAHLKLQIEELKVKHPDLVQVANRGYYDNHVILASHQWVKVHSTTKNDGPTKREKGQPMTMKEKEARLQGRRDAYVLTWLRENLHKRQQNLNEAKMGQLLLRFVAMFGCEQGPLTNSSGRLEKVDQWEFVHSAVPNEPTPHTTNWLWRRIYPVLRGELMFHDTAGATAVISIAEHVCRFLAIDFLELVKKAEEAIPTPKSWAVKPAAKKKLGTKKAAKKTTKAKTKSTRKSKKGTRS